MTQDISMKKFDALVERLFNQQAVVKELKSNLDDQNRLLTGLKTEVLGLLEDHEKEKYVTSFGSVSVTDKLSVKVPKLPEDKEKLFNWLREKEIFNHYATVNSMALNSLYKAEFEASDDLDFSIPGITEVTAFKQLNMRSK